MFFKKALLLFLIAGSIQHTLYGQDDFCDAVTTIMHDAPNKFRNIRGNVTESNFNATMWAAGIKVPGTIGARFVASMGLFYEGAFVQAEDVAGISTVYNKYGQKLDSCLGPMGYTLSYGDNFYPGLRDYKKLVFMPQITDSVSKDDIPSHVTLEAIYSKDTRKYSVVMYIFQH